MSEAKTEYRVNVVAPSPASQARQATPTAEWERVYQMLREAGYTNSQLELLAFMTKDLLKDNPFGELHIVFSKGKAMFIRPMPSVPFE